MIETLISSKTRIKLPMKFFLNTDTKAYLCGLESEFGESSNAIRLNLNRLEAAYMLTSTTKCVRKHFTANSQHLLLADIRSIVLKQVGLDNVIRQIVSRLSSVSCFYMGGGRACSLRNELSDFTSGSDIDIPYYLLELIAKGENRIQRKIQCLAYPSSGGNEDMLKQFDRRPFYLGQKLQPDG